jgi:AmmeMemoRadiSam system protein B
MKWLGSKQLSGSRPPAAAGRFYPSDPAELRALVTSLLKDVSTPTGPVPKALIAPHAGYLYSGAIAASAYAQLIAARDVIKRIILLGPSHFVAFEGLAASSAEVFATPLGNVRLDVEAISRLMSSGQVSIRDEAHVHEHSLEVQLPFLQTVLNEFVLVPLLAGDARLEKIAQVLDMVWGGPETRVVISSDLSHYLNADAARGLDRVTAEAIERLNPDAIDENQACGRIPICGLLHAGRQHGLVGRTVDLRNSGDTAGPSDRVVGYGAFAFAERHSQGP